MCFLNQLESNQFIFRKKKVKIIEIYVYTLKLNRK